jgi:flagellin
MKTAMDGASTAIDTDVKAQAAIDAIDAALTDLTSARASNGATQSRFESVISNLQASSENQAAARGRIMDADFATESANLSRSQVLQQAGTAMLAQANQSSQNVMQLLR